MCICQVLEIGFKQAAKHARTVLLAASTVAMRIIIPNFLREFEL